MCITSILDFAYAVAMEKDVRQWEWVQMTVSLHLIHKYVFLPSFFLVPN